MSSGTDVDWELADHEWPHARPARELLPTPPLRPITDAPYIELHLHSNWSLLDGASSVDELIATARAMGYPALALTDHDGLFGVMEFAQAARAAGIRPITGAELTMEDGSYLTVLAENVTGYGNLCRLVSIARGHGTKDRAREETLRNDPKLPWSALAPHADGLICLTGCRSGRVPVLIQKGDRKGAERALQELVEWFGPDNVFVELQDNLVFGDGPRNRVLSKLASSAEVGTVATGDVHYHVRERHQLQDVLVAIRHRTSLDESHRERRPNSEFFLRPPEDQVRRFSEFPEAVANTVQIAERCSRFDLTTDLAYELPAPSVPEGHTDDGWLARLCQQALEAKYVPPQRPEAERRLREELRLVKKHGLAGFFLIYYEVLELAREVAKEVRGTSARGKFDLPPGRGRGSSVSSIICYLIGLSHIDPVKNNLFLGRFLNDELYSLPDIDLDFPRDLRARLIERVYEHWGADHAALIASFPTYRIRSAIRDVGKALGLPPAELDRLAKLAEGYGRADSLAAEMARYPEYASRVEAPGWRDLVQLSAQLAGFPRHLSEHPGGMVIGSTPLIEQVPIQPAAWPGRYLCHWDKDSIDDARMVKIDFLGLGMLSLVEECIDLIAEQRGTLVDLSRIDFADEQVYDRICAGDTIGVFQIESRAQISTLPRTQPRNLDDLAVQVAIIRPGPIVGKSVNLYIRRREAQRRGEPMPEVFVHPTVHEVLKETLGAVLFQEQVLQVAMNMGGFTTGDADQFRRAMSRKRSHVAMASFREQFMAGAAERSVPAKTAEEVFANLLGFAEYGFPKSHSAAFALIAYQSTWLKEHYAPEFYCALFNNWPMGFYPPHVFTNDAKRHDVVVLRPDINVSQARCTVEHDAVRIGLGYVKGVSQAGGQATEAARASGGEFRSLFDFVHRTGLKREAAEHLIEVGAFDAFGLNRRELLWQLGLFGNGLPVGRLVTPKVRQLRLELPTHQDEVPLPNFTSYERMAADYALLSLSPDQHPMQHLRRKLGEGVRSSRQLERVLPGKMVDIAGLVVCRQRPATAKGIIFLLLEDEYGLANVLVRPELYEQARVVVRTAPFLLVRGKVEARGGMIPLVVATKVEELIPRRLMAMPGGKSWG